MTEGWFPDLSRAGVKYQTIADALCAAIDNGSLLAGERLPPQRDLAARLGVDLTTVSKAYEVVRQRGLIEARGRAGSYVRPHQAPEPESVPFDGGMNMPPELPGGLVPRAIVDGLSDLLLKASASSLHYQPAGGSPQSRAAGASLIGARGLRSDAEQVLVTAGGQNALHAILTANLQSGDRLACAQHVYPGFKAVAERLGIELVALPEFNAAGLRAACERQPIKALYVVPTNDNPTTRTLSAEERRAFAAAAQTYELQVIEDDAYGGLAADPLEPITSYIPHLGWYVASVSKIISPALRVAFVRVPDIAAALRLSIDIHETTIMAPPLNAAMVARWVADGTYTRLLSAMRSEAAQRQELARQTLGDLAYASQPQGYHLWMPLRNGFRARDLADLLRPSGLPVIAAEQFAVGETDEQAVRVSLGGVANHEQLTRGLQLLRGYATAPKLRSVALI